MRTTGHHYQQRALALLAAGLLAVLLGACGSQPTAEEPAAADPPATTPPLPPAPADGPGAQQSQQTEDDSENDDEGALDPTEGSASGVVAPSGSVNLGDLPADAAQGAGGGSSAGDLQVMPAPGVPDPSVAAASRAAQDLAGRLSIDVGAVELLASEAVTWSNSSLGCPAEGIVYTQVQTPGYRIFLSARGQEYVYHADQSGRAVLCRDGRPVE